MPFIQESSDFELHNNHVTVVEGSQYNNTQIIRCQKRRESTIWDEFRRIRTGDVELIENLGSSNVWVHENGKNRKVARRAMSIARVYGSNTDTKFLCARYSGIGAFKAFKRDFDEYSTIRHLNVAQLFAYNDSQYGLPMLIFYDALIPLGRVLSRNKKLRLALELYFRLQRHAFQRAEGGGFIVTNEIWIEPRSGALRRGPYVASPYTITGLHNAPSTSCLGPLSIQTYSDTNTVVDYLIRIFPIDTILELASRGKPSLDQLTAEAWPYLTGSLCKRYQRHIITQWTELRRHICVNVGGPTNNGKAVMEDRSVRFQFAGPAHWRYSWSIDRHWWLISWCSLQLTHDLLRSSEQVGFESAWLAQAHSIFGQLGIREEEWDEYSITTHFDLYICPIEAHTYQEENIDIASNKPTLYLFVRPIPRLSDNETTWKSWAESAYFWSFDPFGREEMSESMSVSLGLPSCNIQMKLRSKSWDRCAYKLMERLQRFKGFDPTTTDYARSLGYPIMEIVGDKGQSQGLRESNDDCSTSEDKELVSVDRDSPCPNNASHVGIPPPLPNDTLMIEISDAETTGEATVGNQRKSKAAGSDNTRRKCETYCICGEFDPETMEALSLGYPGTKVDHRIRKIQ